MVTATAPMSSFGARAWAGPGLVGRGQRGWPCLGAGTHPEATACGRVPLGAMGGVHGPILIRMGA